MKKIEKLFEHSERCRYCQDRYVNIYDRVWIYGVNKCLECARLIKEKGYREIFKKKRIRNADNEYEMY